jgi:hypothetical protein
MRWAPGFGGTCRSPEEVKRESWRETGVLVVCTEDERLIWPARTGWREALWRPPASKGEFT